jgi:hypothetical protein
MKNQIQTFISAALLMTITSPVMVANGAVPSVHLNRVHINTKVDKYTAFESEELRISIDNSSSGFAEGKVCDECEKIRVTISPETKAFEKNTEVPLQNAKSRIGRYATVIFEVETKKAIAIRW